MSPPTLMTRRRFAVTGVAPTAVALAACGTTGAPTRGERRAVTVQYWSRWGSANNTDKVDVARLPEFDQKKSVKEALANMVSYANTKLASG